jgi:SAM-dependent MidA family methyltransferase
MRSHQYASILDQPGQTDLTSHVNFGLLKDLAETQGCVTTIMTQGAFLAQLGIHLRAQKLMENLPMESKLKVQRQIDRLTKKMGELFKVLVVQTPT